MENEMKFSHKIYFISFAIIYLVYGLTFFGILSSLPEYIYAWTFIVQIGLCLFLMFRYHPFRTSYKFDLYDANLIFGASFLLLINVITIPVIMYYWNKFDDYIPYMNHLRNINNI